MSPSEDLCPESVKRECDHKITVNATVATLGNQTSQSRLSSSDQRDHINYDFLFGEHRVRDGLPVILKMEMV